MIRDLMKSDVVTITADKSVKEAAQLMRDRNVGDLIVTEAGSPGQQPGNQKRFTPVGIITDRDLAIDCLASGDKNIFDKKVSDVMAKNPLMVKEDTGLEETIRKMRDNGVGRVVVVDNHRSIVGVLSSSRLLRLLSEELYQLSEISPNRGRVEGAETRDRKLPPNLPRDEAEEVRH